MRKDAQLESCDNVERKILPGLHFKRFLWFIVEAVCKMCPFLRSRYLLASVVKNQVIDL